MRAGLSGWFVPAYRSDAFATLTDSLVAFVLAGVGISVFCACTPRAAWERARYSRQGLQHTGGAGEMIVVGGLSILMGALPVIVAGRDVRWGERLRS